MATANLGRVGFVNKGTYSGATAYKVNDIVVYNSGTYACIQANTGQAPTNTSYWQNWATDNAVHKTGDETIAGVKTFSSSPISSAPQSTAANALARKDYADGLVRGFKNYIINGNFNVWQRGTNFSGLTNGTYSADRWCVYDSVGDINYTVIRNAGVFTGGYGASYTWNSGTSKRSIIQFIENVTIFKVGSSVTVSFEAYTNSTPYSINVGLQAVRGVWASATAIVVSSPIALTNTKTKYSVTLSVPDWSSIDIDLEHLEDTKLALKFDFAADTNGKDFIISNVQLEEGSVATPFEQRPYGLELSLCQRYYLSGLGTVQKHSTSDINGGTQPISILFNMRVPPTIGFSKSGTKTGDKALYYTITSSRLYVSGGLDYNTANIGDYTFFIFNSSAEL